MKPTLGIYIRISKDRTNQVSTEVQQNLGVELANKLGIAYKIYFEKKGTSGGKKIIDRPKLLELVNDIEDGIITHVYFYNQDRSARDEITWFTLANLMIEYKIKLYENQTKVDLGDEDTYMVEGFKAVMNASSRRKTGKKIKDSLKLLVAKGRATNPVLTYGYKKDKNKFIIIDDEEAKIVKNIFKMSLDGIGTGTIAQILNEEGIKTRYAKTAKGVLTITNKRSERITVKDKANVKWQQNTVRQIIKKTWYKGYRTYKGERYNVPAIMTAEYWQKVNDGMSKRKAHNKRPSDRFLLSDVIRCQCGANMYGRIFEAKNENYYKCCSNRTKGQSCKTPSINRPYLEDLIWNKFFKMDILTNFVIKHFENTDEKQKLKELEIKQKQYQQHIKQINEEETTAITLTTKGIIKPEQLDEQLKRLITEKNKINEKLLNINAQIKTYSDISKSSQDIVNDIQSFKNITKFNDKKEIINQYIKDIIVDYKLNHYVVEVKFKIHNIGSLYFIIHRRFYYAVEPFTNDIEIINKFTKIKNGKPIPRTDKEFFDEHFDTLTVFELTNDIIAEIMKVHYEQKTIKN